MRSYLGRGAFAAALLSVGGAGGLGAQQESAPPLDALIPSEAELVFEREVYTYPSFARRNPFKPLTSGDDSGPRYEDLRLLGIIHSADPTSSVALLGIREGAVTQDGQSGAVKRTYRVRRGDRLGNTRVLEIQRTRVVVEVEEFGLTERRSLEVKRPGEGGAQ